VHAHQLNATGGGTSFTLYFPTVSLLLSTRSNLNMTFAILQNQSHFLSSLTPCSILQ
jgi:hypothetical protein